MERLSTTGWLIFSAVWLLAVFGTAALLAALYKRLHPELSFHKLWAVWALVVSVIGGVLFAMT